MSAIASLVLLLAAAGSPAGVDATAACRAAHTGDAAAHIACLEAALREQDEPAAETPTPQPSTAPPVAAAPAATAGQTPTGLGAEQARARQRDIDAKPEAATVQIVSATYDSRGRGIFRMASGQVWLETETSDRYQRLLPDRQYTARIEKAKIGGYRMYVDGVRRMIKVERIE